MITLFESLELYIIACCILSSYSSAANNTGLHNHMTFFSLRLCIKTVKYGLELHACLSLLDNVSNSWASPYLKCSILFVLGDHLQAAYMNAMSIMPVSVITIYTIAWIAFALLLTLSAVLHLSCGFQLSGCAIQSLI